MSSQPATRASLAGDWRRLGPSVRWLLVAAGLLGVGLAVLIAVRPATAGVLPLEAVIALLGSDYVVVAVVGCLAVGCAVVLFGVRVRRGVTAATPPVVEGVQSATYPGVGIDRSDGRSLAAENLAADDRRSRLRAAAIAALQAAEGCSQDRARGRVDDGSWTPDGVASAWLAADAESATDQAGDSRRHPPSERTVKRTLAAISRLAADAEPSDQPRERGSTPEGPQ
jgi:hypothetical protein